MAPPNRLARPQIAAVLCLGLTASCAPPSMACGEMNESAMAVVQLAFGTNIGDRPGVTDVAFRGFLDEVVSPRFPAGMTVVTGEGRWRKSDGTLITEASKVVTMVIPDDPQQRAHLDEIRRTYKARFQQESVMLLTQPGCVSF